MVSKDLPKPTGNQTKKKVLAIEKVFIRKIIVKKKHVPILDIFFFHFYSFFRSSCAQSLHTSPCSRDPDWEAPEPMRTVSASVGFC